MRRGLETISVVGTMILVLVVVIILLVAFSNKFALFNKTGTCAGQGGKCEDSKDCPDEAIRLLTQDCDSQAKVCCKVT